MKKFLLVLMVLVMSCTCVSAMAAGKLRVENENFYAIEEYSTIYGYTFARVENVGDKPIMVNACIMEVFDENGEPITSTDSYNSYVRYLNPNEYTYLRMSSKVEGITTPEGADDYMLTVTGKSKTDYNAYRMPCTTQLEKNVKSGYYTYDYMYATFTNDTDKEIYDVRIVMALLDADDNILYVTGDNLGTTYALMPGSSMTAQFSVDSDFVKMYADKGIDPVRVDAIAYYWVAK